MIIGGRIRRWVRWKKQKYWAVLCTLLTLGGLMMLVFDGHVRTPEQIWVFIGDFHPVMLPLPIGMLVLVLIMEIFSHLQNRKSHATMPLVFTTVFSIFSTLLGYVLMRVNDYSADALDAHLWSAVFFTIALMWTLFFKVRYNVTSRGQRVYWILLLLSSGLMGATGHYGGVVTHGDLMEEAPWNKEVQERESVDDTGQEVYADVILPLLNEKCFSCHGDRKSKGHLRMDSYEAMQKGGDEGECLVPGDLSKSLMIERMRLAKDDEYVMPPENKPQLTDDDLRVIEWWVENGASQSMKVSDPDVPEEIKLIINSQ